MRQCYIYLTMLLEKQKTGKWNHPWICVKCQQERILSIPEEDVKISTCYLLINKLTSCIGGVTGQGQEELHIVAPNTSQWHLNSSESIRTMTRATVTLTIKQRKVYFLILMQFHILPLTTKGCILLLNGWDPVSLEERTTLAPVVAATFIKRTFRDLKTG